MYDMRVLGMQAGINLGCWGCRQKQHKKNMMRLQGAANKTWEMMRLFGGNI